MFPNFSLVKIFGMPSSFKSSKSSQYNILHGYSLCAQLFWVQMDLEVSHSSIRIVLQIENRHFYGSSLYMYIINDEITNLSYFSLTKYKVLLRREQVNCHKKLTAGHKFS
jgi:hypothetical protein